MLHQVDAVGLEPLQALVNLLCRGPPGAPIGDTGMDFLFGFDSCGWRRQ